MDNEKIEESVKKNLDINVNSTAFPYSLYAQATLVSMTKVEMTIEFVYINSHSKNGHVVSRVSIPLGTAKELAEVINSGLQKLQNNET